MELASDNNDLTLTRTQLWSIRISEFLRSPLFGIGYSNDTSLNHLFLSSNEKVKLEPGSSWLAILSMTGIFGFIFFLRVLYSSLKKIKLKYKNSKLLVSVIIFYLIHFIAEGYVISGGSGLNLFFWLILGILYSYNSKISYKTK
jgi:O-antigen ligase